MSTRSAACAWEWQGRVGWVEGARDSGGTYGGAALLIGILRVATKQRQTRS